MTKKSTETVKVQILTSTHNHKGRDCEPGEVIEVSPGDAEWLVCDQIAKLSEKEER